ncbi:unnamed protein product [Brassica rapa]|uniref:Uncharacterized protein n=2 Tax=Brassica TaxID=3705 RepID=A0A8D9LV94_BRACM|nr:unnamed protein product [Brassica napus]CAG7887937.1 unnamed protein product [Brassica rapa]
MLGSVYLVFLDLVPSHRLFGNLFLNCCSARYPVRLEDREIIDDVIIESTSKLNKSHTLVCRADPTAKHINESLKMNPG